MVVVWYGVSCLLYMDFIEIFPVHRSSITDRHCTFFWKCTLHFFGRSLWLLLLLWHDYCYFVEICVLFVKRRRKKSKGISQGMWPSATCCCVVYNLPSLRQLFFPLIRVHYNFSNERFTYIKMNSTKSRYIMSEKKKDV